MPAHGMILAVPGMGTDGRGSHDKDEARPAWVLTGEVPMIKMRRAKTCHPRSHVATDEIAVAVIKVADRLMPEPNNLIDKTATAFRVTGT